VTAGFLEKLAAAPHAFDFNRVMRELEALAPDRPRFGRSTRPKDDQIRLGQEASVEFVAAMLAAWQPETQDKPARLLVHFFGLFGPDGPLPLHLTEYARDRLRNERDPTMQRFADLFHHRALSLFYRAWADVRPTVSFDRPKDDRFATYVGSLAGLGMKALRDRDAMPDLTKLHFAGLLANQTRHADGLSAILSAFFTMKVEVECFVGSWLRLRRPDHTRLGGDPNSATLGGGALLGERVWSRQHKFRLVFGPLSLEDYERLLPGGSSFHKLVPIVRNYAGDLLAWDVRFVLRRQDVPDTRLGQYGRLGWTSWLKPRPIQRDAADLLLNAGADSMARKIDSGTITRERELA
jgi:type VI secretion system protein ImpH